MVRGQFGTVPIYDPLNVVNGIRQPFPNHTIPPDRLDPVGRGLAALFPAPNGPGTVNNFVGPVTRTDDRDQLDLRVDHHVSDAAHVFLRYSRSHGKVSQGSLFGPPGNGYPALAALPELQQSPLINPQRAWSVVFGETHVFSNAVVNEFRAGYVGSHSRYASPATRPLFEEFGIKGISPFAELTGLPVVTITGVGMLGDRRAIPNRQRADVLQVSDHLSWVRGRHGVKLGGEARFKNSGGYGSLLARGEFIFSGQFTSQVPGGVGSAMADLLLGQTSNTILNTRLQTAFRDRYYGVYVHDTCKVSSAFTLNLGLRYELQTPLWERENRMSNFDLDPHSATFGTLVPAREGELRSRTFSNLDTNNLAPRVGFVYQVGRDTIVRGAFGIFFGGLGYHAGNLSGANNLPYYVRVAFPSPSDAPITNLVLADGFPPDALDPRHARNPEAIAAPTDFPLGEVRQWNLGVQRGLAGAMVLSVTYVGSDSAHLRGLNDVNAPVPGPGPLNRRRPFPAFGRILSGSGFVEASYHALQAKVERRFSGGVALLASHTWSHAIDNSLDPGDTPQVILTVPQNPKDVRAEKASADFDVRHRFVTSFIYDLPIGHDGGLLGGSRLARALLGGWQVAGILVAQTGLPMTPALAGNYASTTTPVRPDCLGDGTLARGQRTVDRWFDPLAFAPPARYTFGNCGRNILRAPGLVNLDLLIARNFQIGDGTRLELRGEFFNLTNAVHLGRPNLLIDVPEQAGGITSTQAPARQVQLGLRFVF